MSSQEERRVAWPLAIAWGVLLLGVALSAAAIGYVEPGFERAIAATVGAVAGALSVLGVARKEHWYAPTQAVLAQLSKTPGLTWGSSAVMLALLAATLHYGPRSIHDLDIVCLDATSVRTVRLDGTTVHRCESGRTSFQSWFPGKDRAAALTGVQCLYFNGLTAALVPLDERTSACPMSSFKYSNDYNLATGKPGTFSWERTKELEWKENGPDGTQSTFTERRDEPVEVDGVRLHGVVLQRVIGGQLEDAAGMQLFVPDFFSGDRIVYVRDHPRADWRKVGIRTAP